MTDTSALERRLRRAEMAALDRATEQIASIFRRMTDVELASFTWACARWQIMDSLSEQEAARQVFTERPDSAADVLGEPAALGLGKWGELGGPAVVRPLLHMRGPAPDFFEVMEAAGRRAREPLAILDARLPPDLRVLPRLGLA